MSRRNGLSLALRVVQTALPAVISLGCGCANKTMSQESVFFTHLQECNLAFAEAAFEAERAAETSMVDRVRGMLKDGSFPVAILIRRPSQVFFCLRPSKYVHSDEALAQIAVAAVAPLRYGYTNVFSGGVTFAGDAKILSAEEIQTICDSPEYAVITRCATGTVVSLAADSLRRGTRPNLEP